MQWNSLVHAQAMLFESLVSAYTELVLYISWVFNLMLTERLLHATALNHTILLAV